MEPDPIIPNPPAFETAEASSQPEHQIIPAWINGYSISNKEVMRFFMRLKSNQTKKVVLINTKLRVLCDRNFHFFV